MIPKLNEYKEKWKIESSETIKPGLSAITGALQLLGNPHNDLSVVHIAGTNGKGSTLTFLEQIARKHGLSVGKFMSPCIVDVHDQIQLNEQPIQEEELDETFQKMKDAGLSGKLTDFELLTCAAFLYFAHQNVDLVLIETGMGGREDSTNVVIPIVSIITSIAIEHTKFLGTTIEEIAMHKAGIIKKNRPVVIGDLPFEALGIIRDEARKKNAPLRVLGEHFLVKTEKTGDYYNNHDLQIDQLKRLLPGQHQANNMGLAISAFLEVTHYFKIEVDIENVRQGIKNAQLPNRFEQVYPNVFFDGAHNPQSAEMLVNTIKTQFPNVQIRFIIGMLADKDVKTVLETYETISDEFYFVDFSNPRAMAANQMIQLSNAPKKEALKDYVSFIKDCSKKQGATIVTGSLYLLSEIRKSL